MYALERKRIIKKYLEEHKQAQVHELSGILGVSEVTVRRDLERLEIEGWLTRTHGGAVINQEDNPDPLKEILEQEVDEEAYERIASVALQMVGNGDVVMLTNGIVNSRIAAKLSERTGLTILTNDVAIALRISLQESNRAVLLGGDLNKSEKALFGSMALANLQKFFVHHLFIEVDGINENLQVTVNSQEKADLILGALSTAKEATIICPAEKFSRNAFFRLGHINIARQIITNTEISDTYKSRIFSEDVALFTSVSAFEGSE
jgi:DeoR family transcriptional regulator, fructose operon transcriptional repressor